MKNLHVITLLFTLLGSTVALTHSTKSKNELENNKIKEEKEIESSKENEKKEKIIKKEEK